MAQISFRSKVRKLYNMDDTLAYEYLEVPKFDRKHCDMQAFRIHPKYGAYANSDMFVGILNSIRKVMFPSNMLRLDAIPEGVSVDLSGFLASVEFEV